MTTVSGGGTLPPPSTTSVLSGGSGSRSSTPGSLRARAMKATMRATTIAVNATRSPVDCIIGHHLDRVAQQRTGHAVPAAAALAELEPLDLDHLDAGLAHLGDRVRVAFVGDDDAGFKGDDVV